MAVADVAAVTSALACTHLGALRCCCQGRQSKGGRQAASSSRSPIRRYTSAFTMLPLVPGELPDGAGTCPVKETLEQVGSGAEELGWGWDGAPGQAVAAWLLFSSHGALLMTLAVLACARLQEGWPDTLCRVANLLLPCCACAGSEGGSPGPAAGAGSS